MPHTRGSWGRCTRRRASRHESLFFFNATPTTEIYTLSLHDALPIFQAPAGVRDDPYYWLRDDARSKDRKSTRLNSSHSQISYAVFCLKKKRGDRLLPHPRGSGVGGTPPRASRPESRDYPCSALRPRR